MEKTETLAHPYVNAIFELAKSMNEEQSYLSMLQILGAAGSDANFLSLVDNPRISPDEIINLLLGFLQVPNPEIERLLRLLQQESKLPILPAIYKLFKKKLEQDQNVANALIQSAFAMNDQDKKEFADLLSKKFAKTVNVEVEVKPELIGGVKIIIDDGVIDSSLKGGLAELQQQIM